MPNELIPVNVLIGDRTYRLKVNFSEEEQLRSTVKIINEKIIEFKTQFAGKDMQDYVAMALLWFATDYENLTQTDIDINTTREKLVHLQEMIEKKIAEV